MNCLNVIEWYGSATLDNLETTTTNLASARTELSSAKFAISELTTKLNGEIINFILFVCFWKQKKFLSVARTSEIVDIGKMPTSCADLQRMGQKINGFFLVKGSKKMETVYCDFYPNQNGATYFTFTSSFFIYFFFFFQTNRNGLDTPTSNQRPSISTSREILHFPQLELRFRSIWHG
jgi:hypothetical protein